jgi:hypothetical protein
VAGCCECSDEPLGSGTTELVSYTASSSTLAKCVENNKDFVEK